MSIEFLNTQHRDQRLLHWQSTSSEFAALLLRYGTPAPALRHFGLIQWQAGRLDAAVEALVTALSIAPDDAHLWSDLAGVYDALASPELAQMCAQGAVDRDPGRAAAWLQLAGLKDRSGDRDGAEVAYRRALALDETLAGAHFGLGLLCFARTQLDEAAAHLRCAIVHGYANATGYACLGHVLYLAGDFAGCAIALEEAASRGPLDTATRRKHARARTLQTMIEGRIDDALAAYADLAGDDREDIDDIVRDAFSLLSAFGHPAPAAAIGERRLAQNPDDPVQRYLLDAVSGRLHACAPRDYLERYFDCFAADFDHKLVDVLRYHVPGSLQALVMRDWSSFAAIVDLGCGTGLAAAPLATFGGRMIGVDVSAGMLAQAAKRERYADLVKAEAVAFAAANPGCFDLVFAADMLVYVGDLQPLVSAVACSLLQGGCFALSIETTANGDFALLPSGRFAHSLAYVERLARPCFEIVETVETMLRLEASRPVAGALLVLRKR